MEPHMDPDSERGPKTAHRPPMTRQQVLAAKPYPWLTEKDMDQARQRTRMRMEVAGVWQSNQVLGRRSTIGCVALEITQRCNLDCTLCYLSENSESIKDIPMEEVFRRINQIKNQYGPGTDVQITGGDPTLRKRSELLEIVRYIRDRDMRPTLMTNGIAATRDLIEALIESGLNDIAFHVDLTEERKGYDTEEALNKVRSQYIERARGLPIAVVFNTTVFAGNFEEIPNLIKFFRRNADVVGMASFQLQADTGRGALRKRAQLISLETVTDQIQKGAESKISFESVRIGHPKCHQYGLTMEVNGNIHDFFDDSEFFQRFLYATRNLELDRTSNFRLATTFIKWFFAQRGLWGPALAFFWRKISDARVDLWKARGRVHKLSFFVQNFMDASQLEEDRIHACSFMVMTGQGPISMCMHNAKRDEFILQPVQVTGKQPGVWDPLTGKTKPLVHEDGPEEVQLPPNQPNDNIANT